jgi:hypothetical protein
MRGSRHAEAFVVREQWMVSASKPVNIRAEPSLKCEVLGQKAHGELVTASKRLEGNGGWVYVADAVGLGQVCEARDARLGMLG